MINCLAHGIIIPQKQNIFNQLRIANCELRIVVWDCQLVEFTGVSDHCHLLIDINPKVQISAFANNLKTVTSRLIRKEFPEHCNQYYKKPVFWKIGYFVSSTGGANLETVKRYIQSQDTPEDK